MTVRRSESPIGSTSRQLSHVSPWLLFTDKMKTSIAYIIAAALFGATQAAITPMNNIIRHEYNLNARAGVHGNIERDEPAVAPEGDVLQPIV
ncbi:hypothetical protein CCUS01_15542 [Colletotrichum cuscutae]|uniref:Uncharacterized protein n=1 Tax=Colletotrichum cuscutae TaxID=1209917 RepID=A0AAI9Y4F0_9PEZI|nr:hypothetical protein CCUS01_15542 [Colletotrichum cuscutae]